MDRQDAQPLGILRVPVSSPDLRPSGERGDRSPDRSRERGGGEERGGGTHAVSERRNVLPPAGLPLQGARAGEGGQGARGGESKEGARGGESGRAGGLKMSSSMERVASSESAGSATASPFSSLDKRRRPPILEHTIAMPNIKPSSALLLPDKPSSLLIPDRMVLARVGSATSATSATSSGSPRNTPPHVHRETTRNLMSLLNCLP